MLAVCISVEVRCSRDEGCAVPPAKPYRVVFRTVHGYPVVRFPVCLGAAHSRCVPTDRYPPFLVTSGFPLGGVPVIPLKDGLFDEGLPRRDDELLGRSLRGAMPDGETQGFRGL